MDGSALDEKYKTACKKVGVLICPMKFPHLYLNRFTVPQPCMEYCSQCCIHEDILAVFFFFWPLPLGKKVFYDFTTVSMSVTKCVFSKTAHKKLAEPDFLEKNLILGMMPKNTKKICFFWTLKKNSLLMCRFFGFRSCTIMAFMIP